MLKQITRYHPRNIDGFPVRIHPHGEKPRTVIRRVRGINGESDEIVPILPRLLYYYGWHPDAFRSRIYHWLGMSAYPRRNRCVMRDCKRPRRNLFQTCGARYCRPWPGRGRFET